MDRRVILGTAGHIDHGKTALVRALTGVDTDRLPEEKRRGITIDLGFAPLELEGGDTIGIVDVPGHEAFVRTMLAGASGIDLAMLVIAADEGVMPQTREHLDILSLLEIPGGVIALTKCDLADDEWRSLVEDDIRTLCAGTLLDAAELVPVSAVTGLNLDKLRGAIARAAGYARVRRANDLFRMPVDRAFTVKGTGTVVTGTIWSGTVTREAMLRVLPGGRDVRVRGIQCYGNPVDAVFPGTRAALALAGCDLADVERGSTVVAARDWSPTSELDVTLRITESDFSPTPRTRVRVHIGTSEAGARLSRLRRVAPDLFQSRLLLDEPVVARGRDRFVIRNPSPPRTVGGGEIVDPYPSRRKSTQFVNEPSANDVDGRLSAMLMAAGTGGLAIATLPVRIGYSVDEVKQGLTRLGATVASGRAYGADGIGQIEAAILDFIASEVANHPLEDGVSIQTLRASVNAPVRVVELVLDRLAEEGRITMDGALVKPAGWTPTLNEREQELSNEILQSICAQPREPPSVGELQSKYGVAAAALLRRLEREGDVERVGEDRYYSRSALAELVGLLRSSLEPGRPYSPSELREVLGLSRKYLIPFLEFCDRRSVTERNKKGRVIRINGG